MSNPAKAVPPVQPASDARLRFSSVTMAGNNKIRIKRQYLDGTITAARAEQVTHGSLELIDDTRFLEVRVTYTDGTPDEMHKVPWAQIGQVTE